MSTDQKLPAAGTERLLPLLPQQVTGPPPTATWQVKVSPGEYTVADTPARLGTVALVPFEISVGSGVPSPSLSFVAGFVTWP